MNDETPIRPRSVAHKARPFDRRYRGIRLAAALTLVGAASASMLSCRGCQKDDGPRDALALAAPDAPLVAWIPKLGALAEGLDSFIARSTKNAGKAMVRSSRLGIARQLGLDPLDVGQFANAGLDGKRDAMVFAESGTPDKPMFVLPVGDRAKFDQFLLSFVEKTDGANKTSETQRGDRTIRSVGRPFGSEVVPVLHWLHVGSYAVLARADATAALHAALDRLARPPAGDGPASIKADPVFARLRGKVANGLLWVFARGTAATAFLRGSPESPSAGAITSVQVGPQGLSTETFVDLPIAALAPALDSEPPHDLAQRVAEDGSLLFLSRAANPKAIAALRSHPAAKAHIDHALARIQSVLGADPDKEILPLLAGPVTASVHVDASADAPRSLARLRSLRALLKLVHVAFTAELNDPAAMLTLLEKTQKQLSEKGTTIGKRTRKVGDAEATIYEPARANPPRLGWAVWKNFYVYGAGVGRLDKILDHLAASDKNAAPRLGPASVALSQKKGSSVLILRSATLADAAQSIAGGGARGALTMAATVGGLLEFLRTVGDVAISLSAEPEGLRVHARQALP